MDTHQTKRKYARSLEEIDITENAQTSVLTQKKISNNQDKHSNREHKNEMSMIFKPMLATLVKAPPAGKGWISEVKYDGYRIIAFIDKGKVRLITRSGNDWTKKFIGIANNLERQKLADCILDGEVVALDNKSKSNFQLLQNALDNQSHPNLHYYVFDLPFHSEHDLSKAPLKLRRKILEKIMVENENVHLSQILDNDPNKAFVTGCKMGYEGIICKSANSQYLQKRSESWLKLKCEHSQEFIIIGYTKPSGTREYFGSLLLGYYRHKKLTYAGRVGTGFNHKSLLIIHKKLQKIIQIKTPLVDFSKKVIPWQITWVKPQLLCEVIFSEWTQDGRLRHPVFKGLRIDKAAKSVIKEIPKSQTMISDVKRPANSLITLTHPDKILLHKAGITKRNLIEYYEKIAEYLLSYIKDRPVTWVRCTDDEKYFYQKHWTKNLPTEFSHVTVQEKTKDAPYLILNNTASIIMSAQLDVIEFHTWQSRQDKLNYPDQLVFDLDPAISVKWQQLLESAILVRDALSALGLKSNPKLTGGKGIHIVVPVVRTYDFTKVKTFTRIFAEILAKKFPTLFVANMRKVLRKGKIFIDYFRNDYGATAIAAFSPRARDTSSIAVPVSWDYLEKSNELPVFTISDIDNYFKLMTDKPWKQIQDKPQRLTKAHFNFAKDIKDFI